MRRRLLIIVKDPEFDSRGEVVLGQCEPFTSGWNLQVIEPDGKTENLASGTYVDLRRIQDACLGIEDTPGLKKRVKEQRSNLLRSISETVAVTRKPGSQF